MNLITPAAVVPAIMSNEIRTILLLGVLSAILIGFGGLLGRSYVLVFALFSVAMNIGAYFFSDKIVLAMHRAQPVSEAEAPRLYAIVRELAMRAQIPMPRVFLIPSPQPNAFATGRNPEKGVVAVTQGILQILNERELRGVLAHEIAYSSPSPARGAARAGDLSRGAGEGLRSTSPPRGRGRAASEARGAGEGGPKGAQLSNDPDALATALEKLETGAHHILPATAHASTASLFIVNPFSGTCGLVNLFSTHPPVAERVRRLRSMMFASVA